MNRSTDRDRALRLLAGLEDGGMDPQDARTLAQDLDPVLLYVIVRYLREVYPASAPAASAVLERVVRLTRVYPDLPRLSAEGEQDPVAGWFSDAYSFADFRGRRRELLELVVEKLES